MTFKNIPSDFSCSHIYIFLTAQNSYKSTAPFFIVLYTLVTDFNL